MYDRIAGNVRKSWMLVAVFFLLTGALGYVFGYFTGFGVWGLAIAIAFSAAMSWGSYLASDRIALAISRAVPADETKFAQLHNVVEGLSIAAGIPKPRVYLVEDMAPNAFATGRDPEHAAIALTTGLLLKMKRDELEGVVAHELAHVKNRDTLVMTLAVTLVGVVVLLADWMMRALWWGAGGARGKAFAPLAVLGILLMITAPLFAQLLQFAISRQREFLADADAVFLTRHPDGLISALEKLRDDTTVVRSGSKATAHLWIEDPNARHAKEGGSRVGKRGAWLNRLFDTHPPLDQRIAALRSLAPQPVRSGA
ncbi:MAG: M48 family metalloprotease [Actinomycetota bacterium]